MFGNRVKLVHITSIRISTRDEITLPLQPANLVGNVFTEHIAILNLVHRCVWVINSNQHNSRIVLLVVQHLVVHLGNRYPSPVVGIEIQEDWLHITVRIRKLQNTVRTRVDGNVQVIPSNKVFYARLYALPVERVKLLPLRRNVNEPERCTLMRAEHKVSLSG